LQEAEKEQEKDHQPLPACRWLQHKSQLMYNYNNIGNTSNRIGNWLEKATKGEGPEADGGGGAEITANYTQRVLKAAVQVGARAGSRLDRGG